MLSHVHRCLWLYSSVWLHLLCLLQLLHLSNLPLSRWLTFVLLSVLHTWENVPILNLSACIPPSFNLGLIHLDHLLVAKVLIMTAFIVISRSKEKFIPQLFSRNLMICRRWNVSFVVRCHFTLHIWGVITLFTIFLPVLHFQFFLPSWLCCVALWPTLSMACSLGCAQLLF